MKLTYVLHIPSGKYCKGYDEEKDKAIECDILTCTTSMDNPHFMCDLFREGVYSDPVYDDNVEKCLACRMQFSLGATAKETYDVVAREKRHA